MLTTNKVFLLIFYFLPAICFEGVTFGIQTISSGQHRKITLTLLFVRGAIMSDNCQLETSNAIICHNCSYQVSKLAKKIFN